MSIQAMVDAINKAGEATRAGYHLTLGGIIEKLEPHKDSGLTVPLCGPDSYRGYYSDLAFDRGETPIAEFVGLCKSAVGTTFEGYKGGYFIMSEDTPLWVAGYGDWGPALMDVRVENGEVVIVTKEID